MILGVLAGLIAFFALTLFGVVGLAAFSMAEVVVSGDDLEELPREDKDDIVTRIGSALELMLKMPYSCFSTRRHPRI